MKIIHIVGKKNHGKTTLITDLITALTAQKISVGTIKHCHQIHELDTPGKDSHSHRLAGASTVAAVTPNLTVVYKPQKSTYDFYDALRNDFSACEIVIVEGDARGPGPKIEVWRATNDTPPLTVEYPEIEAVITDDQEALVTYCEPRKVFRRSDIEAIAAYTCAIAKEV